MNIFCEKCRTEMFQGDEYYDDQGNFVGLLYHCLNMKCNNFNVNILHMERESHDSPL